ncbi:Aste57867_2081 [Aphanomyces stellatus]|uniref:Aste57867_2081 protein n=1 Tax=Aphanomyces stellatus TaxID=120398 RepID=A0A485KBV2_9STRA|nr:hypothetical protein As57867_002077 [Aphanomyces stellatus]VFT79284.1 Aste57867_2081 [Aphanomyces stellatus]
MDRFVKCPSCKVNIPKDDIARQEGDPSCTVCKKPIPSDVLSATAAPAAPKMTTKRRWIELKSKRGKTYYHNNDTGEDRWDMPPDFEAVETVAVGNAPAAPTMVNFKNDDPVRNAIMLQQNKQEARKQGISEDMIEALAAQQAAQQAGSSLRGAIAAMEKQHAKKKDDSPKHQHPPSSSSQAPHVSTVGVPNEQPEPAVAPSSCALM